jgi:murein DD-endopeptidase MepM/ murein hydrolase activator NlpD
LATAAPDHDDTYAYRLPYGPGVTYTVLQGYESSLSHFGADQYTVDFAMEEGTPVHAARDGLVVAVVDSHGVGCWRQECAVFANFLRILHSDGTTGEYFHLRENGALVAVGERVARGQLIALSGDTGFSSAPHLHFGVYTRQRDGSPQSLGVRFQTRSGPIDAPRRGARYLNMD